MLTYFREISEPERHVNGIVTCPIIVFHHFCTTKSYLQILRVVRNRESVSLPEFHDQFVTGKNTNMELDSDGPTSLSPPVAEAERDTLLGMFLKQ